MMPAPEQTDTENQRPPEPEGSRDNSTFLVNKEVYPEAKPGDEFTVRVVRVHDEEMECELAGGENQEDSGEEQPPEPDQDSMGAMGDMM